MARLRLPLLPLRVAIALALSLPALVIENTPAKDTAIGGLLHEWSQGVLTQVLYWRQSVHVSAPPVVVVNFGGQARLDYFQAHGQIAPNADEDAELSLPQQTPLALVQDVMEGARRGGAKVVLIDVDVLPIDSLRASRVADRDPAIAPPDGRRDEIGDFKAFLEQWSKDPNAPLTAFARTAVSVKDGQAYHLTETKWDGVVDTAPNLIWAQSQIGLDGVTVFWQRYYECLRGANRPATPSLAITGLAGVQAATPQAAKVAIEGAMKDLCPRPVTPSRTSESDASGPGFQLALGQGFTFPNKSGLINYHLKYDLSDNEPLKDQSFDPRRVLHLTGVSTVKGGPRDNAAALIVRDPRLLTEADPEVVRGAIVILGSSQPTAPDRHATPYKVMDGDIIVANATRGLIAFGPVRRTPILLQLCMIAGILFLIHEFYDATNRLNRRAHRVPGRIWWPIIRIATAGPMAKIYALGLVYVATVVIGWIMLDNGYWQAVPFIAATIYILIGDAVDIIEGRNVRAAGG